ncbi:hypothetical protein E5D57_006262 [Metarhizium anisopliae]|nr:hypothetical protein E5D57_006262 [Metarhizium anisopliae]
MQQIHILGAEREPRGYYTPFAFECLDTTSVPPVRGKRTNTPVQCPPFSSHRGTQHITSHVSSMLSPVYMKRTLTNAKSYRIQYASYQPPKAYPGSLSGSTGCVTDSLALEANTGIDWTRKQSRSPDGVKA